MAPTQGMGAGDFSVSDLAWHPDGEQVYVQYEDRGQLIRAAF